MIEPAWLPANKNLVPTVFPAREVNYVPESRPAPGFMEISPRIKSRPGPGLAKRKLPAQRRPLVYEYYAKVVRKEEMFRKMYEDYKCYNSQFC